MSDEARNPNDNVFKEWHGQNEWYLNDEESTIYANAIVSSKPDLKRLPYREYLETVGGAVKKAFPHKFENPNRGRPSAVDGGSVRSGFTKPQGHTYASLDREARETCDRLVKQGRMTRDQYVKSYFSEED